MGLLKIRACPTSCHLTMMCSKPFAKSTENRKRAAAEIEKDGQLSDTICFHCFEHSLACIIMPSSRSLKCANCAKRGIKCVDTSWKSLDETRQITKEKIEKDVEDLVEAQAQLAKVIARLSRNRKILSLAESRAKEKTICLLDELEEEEEEERRKNGGLSDGEIAVANADLSSLMGVTGPGLEAWGDLGFPDGSPIASGEPSSGAT